MCDITGDDVKEIVAIVFVGIAGCLFIYGLFVKRWS